tara:strand:+ start:1964 stop:2323 length:360 start_codon:yes stop_codon:yes gene_type:complete
MSKIKIVRLNSGEEILCTHTLTDGIHNLKKPLIIIPSGGGNIGFMGWMPYADIEKTGVNIPDSFVAFVIDPDKQLKGEYESYISGIITTKKSNELIIPQSHMSTSTGEVKKDGPIGLAT